MQYKVVAIAPVQKNKETGKQVAQDLEDLINRYNSEGWEYVRVESLKTWVAPVNGCFGLFGNTPGYFDEKQMIVFKK